MSKETVEVIGQQINGRWSKFCLDLDDLVRFKKEDLSEYIVELEEDPVFYREKRCRDILIPLSILEQILSKAK